MDKLDEALMAYMAEKAARYDTVMAWAFRRALGIEKRPPRGSSPKGAKNSRHDGARRLMAQRHGVRGL